MSNNEDAIDEAGEAEITPEQQEGQEPEACRFCDHLPKHVGVFVRGSSVYTNCEKCMQTTQIGIINSPKPDSAIRQVVDEQANDEGLWCETKYASEAYLQEALRRLHEVIEGKSAEECAIAVLANR